jgi:hypothetical protein
MRPTFALRETGDVAMKSFSWAVLVLLGLVGCGAGSVDAGADVDGEGDALLSTTTPGFVTFKVDTRTCAAPACGGFYLSQPNRSVADIYVATLDWSKSGLSASEIAKATGAAAGEVVLRGTLTRQDSKTHTKNFVVLDAYRGMPGRTPNSGDALFTVAGNGKVCVAAPCNSFTATKLNSSAQPKDFSNLSVASAAAAFVDQTWLNDRVVGGGALVFASLVSGEKLAAGTEKVLDATQVYVHLPEGPGACPHHVIACGSGQVQVFERDTNRCVISTGCMAPGMCSMMMPSCPAGYTLSSWRSDSNGCNAFACDPTWIVQ